jgi:hypothetical protein
MWSRLKYSYKNKNVDLQIMTTYYYSCSFYSYENTVIVVEKKLIQYAKKVDDKKKLKQLI